MCKYFICKPINKNLLWLWSWKFAYFLSLKFQICVEPNYSDHMNNKTWNFTLFSWELSEENNQTGIARSEKINQTGCVQCTDAVNLF